MPDRKLTSDEEEAKRIAELGKPVLGEHSKLEVIIEESYEFKVRAGDVSGCDRQSQVVLSVRRPARQDFIFLMTAGRMVPGWIYFWERSGYNQ